MTSYSFNIELADGTPVLIRPVESGDRHLLELGLENLSRQSRYYRFFRPVARLSENDLNALTRIDQINHMAVGAIDLSHDDVYPIGIARCIRLDDQPDRAEVAVTVIDSHQGKGLGTTLLAAVAHLASAHRIESFVAAVLTDNHPMLHLLGELGAIRSQPESGVSHLRIPIYRDADKYPDSPTGAAFRNVYRRLA
ncbi:MAG: GNAT family N-acetyltransferase [Hyphomicrobiaceae bacterium]